MSGIQTKEFGDWAVVFWKKGSKTLHIAQNQGDPGTTDFWMVGTTTRQFDYESGWLPNKEWFSAIKAHFSKDKAIQLAKENAEKSLKESKYVDKDIEPLGKKLSHHSDDGFIDFCTAKVLDDLNKGDKKKLDFYEFWDWAAEVGSKDIVELISNDFKNGKLDKDSAVYRFYKTYEDIKDLSLKDPKKFVKQYGWAYEDKIKDKSLKERAEKSLKESKMRRLKENTSNDYWSNGGVEALKQRFHEICSEHGVWTNEDKGCEVFGLRLAIYRSRADDSFKGCAIKSSKYYLSTIGNEIDLGDDFDKAVTEYLENYSELFKTDLNPKFDSGLIKAQSKLLVKNNPEPWNDFIADEGSFRKALRQAFKSNACKYIDMDEQYDVYGEEHFEVDSTSDDAELSITFGWCGDKNPDDYILFKFDSNLNYTATMNGETVTGQGYEDAANQYVLRIANKYAEGEFAKEYEPECYELRVYLRQDFYAKASKNIWQGIESILEDNCGTYTNYQPEDWVDDRAAVWTSVEVDDLKRVLNWLKKRRSAPRIEIWDENKNNVTSQFWTPKVEESTNLKERRIESGELNGVEDYLYVIRSAGLQYIEGEKTKKGATPVVIKLTNGEARLRIFESGNYTLFTDFMGWEGLTAEEFADDLKDLLSFRG